VASKKTPPKPQSSQPLPLPVVKPTTGGIKPPPSKTPTGGKPIGGTLATSGFPLPASGDKQPSGQTLALPSPDKPAVEKKGFDSSPFDDLAQRMAEQEAAQKPSDVQRHIIRFDYPSFQLERAAQGSELARQFLRRITHQRMTIDAFLDGAPSVEKALDKLFLKFGEDEEEDAALLKVARLYLKERAENEQREALLMAAHLRGSRPTVAQETPEAEPSEPTAADIELVRQFDDLYREWSQFDGTLEEFITSLQHRIAGLGAEQQAQIDVLQAFIDMLAAAPPESITAHIATRYEELLERVFGYDVEIDPTFQGTIEQQLQMLLNLGEASLAILDYFDSIITEGGILDAAEAFRTFFGYNPGGADDRITVHLGANAATGDATYGRVELPQPDQDDLYYDDPRWNQINFGSEVNVATIVHEFGHQLDRWFILFRTGVYGSGITNYLSSAGEGGVSPIYTATDERINLQGVYDNAIIGFAGKQMLPSEYWADLFMTAVLGNSNVEYRVQTIISPDAAFLERMTRRPDVDDREFWLCGHEYTYLEVVDPETGDRFGPESFTIECSNERIGWQSDYYSENLGGFLNTLFSLLLNEVS
jgi:hypothetical protein